ncbi:shikimate kinase [Aurantibacter aestuarii]|uniref:Shikimate kinase n=1 Tax=Aurantibacter aestuarii TaxID=1266046 RepID=A0A2T1N832_9FLAO|nr:shikimate kinase [Aurantibacter aestuarii]PSG88029.1 shikimate kinase [Aurantibacter aestuarii]
MKIILLGYMGSGKSTIGYSLSKSLNMPCIDLDEYIEDKENKTIKMIFSEQGEIYFRKKERFYLEELINKKDSFILALGGGTPCYYDNMDLINNSPLTISIYLKTDIDTLVIRLSNEKSKRPIIAGFTSDELLKEFIAKHIFERSYFYTKAQHIVNNVTLEKSIKQIENLLK